MKPKPIKRFKEEAPMIQDTLQSKKMRIETPLGNIESDSGNHLIDLGSILIVIVIFFLMKKFYKAT